MKPMTFFLFLMTILLNIATPAIAGIDLENIKIGGALRGNYEYLDWDEPSKDKGGDFKKLIPRIQKKTKQVILSGEAADTIAGAFGQEITTESVPTIADAVNRARKFAAPGDVVLLSPGCTSFDQYGSYEERGEDFKNIVIVLNRKNA